MMNYVKDITENKIDNKNFIHMNDKERIIAKFNLTHGKGKRKKKRGKKK